LLCIREVPGSGVDVEVGYPDRGISGVSQSLQADAVERF
jgi:hypothetical protein